MRVNENRNYCVKNTPTFGAIKSVKCTGLYEEFPDLGKDLVDTFRANPKAMEFCKKYDVDIVFSAIQTSMSSVKTSVELFYDDITKGKFKKFWQSLNSNEDKVTVSSFSGTYNYDIPASLRVTTLALKERIAAAGLKGSKGDLDSRLKITDEKLQKAIAGRADILARKQAKKATKDPAQVKLEEDTGKLEDSIKNLIDSSK